MIISGTAGTGKSYLIYCLRQPRQVFPHHAQQALGGCSCLLFGDFGQLPSVMDLPLHCRDARTELSDTGH